MASDDEQLLGKFPTDFFSVNAVMYVHILNMPVA